MLKKLRVRFIVIAMTCMTLVLCFLIGFINVKNYTGVIKRADNVVQTLLKNGGRFPLPDKPELPAEPGNDVPPPPADTDGTPAQDNSLAQEGSAAQSGTDVLSKAAGTNSGQSPDNENGSATPDTATENTANVPENGGTSAENGDIEAIGALAGAPAAADVSHLLLHVKEDETLPSAPTKGAGNKPPQGNDSPETPYETRYFTVSLDENGTVLSSDVQNIAAIDEETAVSLAGELFTSRKTKGFASGYRYGARTENGDTLYVFVDISRDLGTYRSFFKASIFMSLGGLFAVFLLIVVLSYFVFRPVAETYEKQKRFITDANHELKTPLTVIGASCEALSLTEGENEWTQAIQKEVERLTEMVDKLVFLCRADEGDDRRVPADFPLSELAEEQTNPFLPLAAAENKQFSVRIDPGLAMKGDTAMIGRLFSLLLDNAFKYCPAGGKIDFSLKKCGKTAKLILQNDAEGLPKGDLSRVFERFYRLDASRNGETGGHGIGLSVAKAIADAHKSKISACSPDGKTFVVTVVF